MKTTQADFEMRVYNFLLDIASSMPCTHLKFITGMAIGKISSKISSVSDLYKDAEGLIDLDAFRADILNGYKAIDSDSLVLKPVELFGSNPIALELFKPLNEFTITQADINKHFS